ncbi:oxidoreductase [Flavobacterium sp. MXW15]|uniref:Oxidoreductase n=1 Tax=Xanthomonas chitinilytica TaxID=2989819 RepID=A0ABT3JT04_9XANT|nr:oxidoreductase [Xanthomonas sp. H13-6]MCW4455572.1 oxidoreductase [Flavobacterium sp. MXW15]MCW4471622.1 oxidoreductase [Xanthomonas sp. H13-6]
MPPPLNLALVGYGFAGRTFHAPLIAQTPGLRLHGIVTGQQALAGADFPDARIVDDADRMLADADVDGVVIATPNRTHAALALAALAAGKHVLVDKPFTVTSAEARAVIEAARRAGRIASVFHNRRWDADFLTLQRLLAEGTLGRIGEFHSHFDRMRPQPRDRWRESGEPGAGLWFDLGPHLLDQALQLFGPPLAIQADLMAQRPGARSDDWFHAVLHYPAHRAFLHAGSLVADHRLRFAVHGSAGSYLKHGLDVQEAQLRDGRLPGSDGWGVDPLPGRLTTLDADGRMHQRDIANERGDYRCCYAALRDAMRGEAPPPVSAAQALAVMQLLEAGRRSADSGQRVRLD